MKTASYTWKVIINIITVIFVIAVFQVSSNSFETAVLAILVIIYLNLISFSAIWGMSTLEANEALDKELKDIKKLINPNLNHDEDYTEEYKKEIEGEKIATKNHLNTKYYINLGFQFVLWLIALGYLLSAVAN